MPSSPAPTGTGLSNYLITYVDGDLTVNRAALTITANDNTKTYGGTLNFSGNEFSDSGLLNSDSITSVTLTSAGAVPTAIVTHSPYAIIPSAATGAGLGNYTITYVDGTLTVTPAPLTITADNQTKVYGAALPTLTASYTGFVNSDTAASLTVPPSLTTTATAASHVSGNPFPITASGASSSNYTISYEDGSLTIIPANPIITWGNPADIVYGTARVTRNSMRARRSLAHSPISPRQARCSTSERTRHFCHIHTDRHD